MTISIPNLRKTTLTVGTGTPTLNLTVPAGKTYLIKYLLLDQIVTGFTTARINAIINGATFNLYERQSTGIGATALPEGSALSDSIILNEGDQIQLTWVTSTGSLTLSIGYWILEDDFELNYTIPSLRKSELLTFGTITVPANETWIVKNISLTINRAAGIGVDPFLVNLTTNSNTFLLTDTSVPAGASYSGFSMNQTKQILKEGDTIVLSGSQSGSYNYNRLQVMYWILETDFSYL